MTPSRSQISSRVPALDGLRGLAISLVVLFHFGWFKSEVGWAATAEKVAATIYPLGWTGVDLFFVLSGFLIGGILMDHRSAKNYFTAFHIRRVCRIFPLYFFWLFLFFILAWQLSAFNGKVWHGWLFEWNPRKVPAWSFFVFLQNFYYAKTFLAYGPGWMGVTWSLAVEEQFYLLLPVVVWFVPVRKLPYLLLSLVLLTPFLRLFLYCYHPEIYLYVFFFSRWDTLFIGVLCAYLIRQDRWRDWLKNNQSRLYQVLAVLFAGTVYLTIRSEWGITTDTFEMDFLGFSWMALFYACLLLAVITAKRGILKTIMELPVLRNFGMISYGIYIMHQPVNILLHGLILGKDASIANLSDGAVTLLAFGTTVLLATLSWCFFERPIINWGHSFSYANAHGDQST